jgi:hypothetical protein
MITVVIFSFDRAIQLSCLLESIKIQDVKKTLAVHVIYATSSDEFSVGYKLLQDNYPEVSWLRETKALRDLNKSFKYSYWHNWYWWFKSSKIRFVKTNFKELVLKVVSDCDNKYFMFLTDDSIFYRRINIDKESLSLLEKDSLDFSYSLRHGSNLVGGNFSEEGRTINWNVYKNDRQTDWGFPFSVDGHIYHKGVMQSVLDAVAFVNPNTLEGNVACYVSERKMFANVIANNDSCLVGFELNCVQTTVQNNNMEISKYKLNDYFLNGYTLKIAYDLFDVVRFRPKISGVYVNKEESSICLFSEDQHY